MASGSSGTPWSWPKSETSKVPTPFSCTRTRKSSRPRSTGRCVPGARPAEVAPGRVKKSPPTLLLWLAWICSLLRVVSDGGGWNGDGAAGCPAVVVALGDVGGVVVGGGAGGGGDGSVVVAGGAGGGRRARRRGCAAPPAPLATRPAASAPAPPAAPPGRWLC